MVGSAEKLIKNKLNGVLDGKEQQLDGEYLEELLLAVGEVAAGVAHEIRNPLTGIKGFSQLLENNFKPGDKEWPYIKTILRETEKIETLIEELLVLSKPTFPRKRLVDLNKLIDEVLPLLAREAVNKRIKIHADCDDNPIYVRVDVNQIKIALFQIGIHSISSVPIGDTIRITTREDREAGCTQIIFSRPWFILGDAEKNVSTTVVKKIIENHRGVLEINNITESENRIIIKLPNN